MGKSSRITRIGISKQKKDQLKIKKNLVAEKAHKKRQQEQTPKTVPEPKKKFVTDGMTDYLKLMGR
jgi:hypothetical protein